MDEAVAGAKALCHLLYDHWSRFLAKPLCRPYGAHLHFYVFPRVPLRFTLGYFLVAPAGAWFIVLQTDSKS